jgi:hypothetical protein
MSNNSSDVDDVIKITTGFICVVAVIAVYIDYLRRRFSSDPQTRNSVRDPNKAVRIQAKYVKSTPKMIVVDFDVRKNVYLEKRLISNLTIVDSQATFEIPYRYLVSNHLSATNRIS